MKILCVVGARPNFVKIAPIVAELKARGVEQVLLHTGQHYDDEMSQVFFDDLGIPRPDVDLGVGSAPHAVQTGEVMIHFDEHLLSIRPDAVVVVGDVNSTLACALAAVKRRVPVVHVEAGLRCGDRYMPEEINRVLTDHISELLFTPSSDADDNLRREGIDPGRIFRVGNIMIDSLLAHRERALKSDVLERLSLLSEDYAVVTLHRPENVDGRDRLLHFCAVLTEVAERLPVVFPIHPRTRSEAQRHGLLERLENTPGLVVTSPLGYLDFMALALHSKIVLTDSGGLQEETTVYGIPCLTLRPSTERPITVTEGTNTIVGDDRAKILAECERILAGNGKRGRTPELWDGRTAPRIVDVLTKRFG
ncbi:MAG: UDP-N-acetylglucosamine 2-epimerase (non-hydrolyzing) [Myxococcales bacterium]|nr:MAG: UDP-N-acetylglucosamine 2-epimerase (non-hydrolyzing) [Myxococcales bacterium]